jgi:hypothetical protein
MQDFFSAVFCFEGDNNREPVGANQRFFPNLTLVFGNFSDFAFPGFCYLTGWTGQSVKTA